MPEEAKNEPMLWVLGIPYVNRADLLRKAVDSISLFWPAAFIIDNSPEGEIAAEADSWPIRVLRPAAVSLTLAQSLGVIFLEAKRTGAEIACFMHNDAEASAETPAKLIETVTCLRQHHNKWGAVFTNYDTLVAFNMEAAASIGDWDINLPQYYGDNDYYRRLQLAGFELIESGLSVIHHNDASSTLKSNLCRLRKNEATFPLFGRYYEIKWGGPPGNECYTIPFNDRHFLHEVNGLGDVIHSDDIPIACESENFELPLCAPKTPREWPSSGTLIPRMIWQTSRSRELTEEALGCRDLWLERCPGWSYRLMADEEMREFVHDLYPGDVAEVYDQFPLGVMRADLWRVLVMHRFGGLYADTDTVPMVAPEEWIGATDRMVCAVEPDLIHLCNWTFAAEAGHPALEAVIHEVVRRAKGGIDVKDEHFVHRITGPGVFRDGIKRYLKRMSADVASLAAASEAGELPEGMRILEPSSFNGRFVRHFFASISWPEDYPGWRKERELLRR